MATKEIKFDWDCDYLYLDELSTKKRTVIDTSNTGKSKSNGKKTKKTKKVKQKKHKNKSDSIENENKSDERDIELVGVEDQYIL